MDYRNLGLAALNCNAANLLVLEAAFTLGGLNRYHQGRTMMIFRD